MKINILDAHDRLLSLKKKDFDIAACCQNLIDQRPFGDYPFYIFAHARTEDNGRDKRLVWQPRLTKPKAQSNSMLFKVYPGTDAVKIIWMIPARELWEQYQKGNLTEHETVCVSIDNFLNHRKMLEAKEDDDLPDETIDAIYRGISMNAKHNKMMEALWLPKPTI